MPDETYIRQKLKARYNRRFFLAAHLALLFALLIASPLLRALAGLILPVFVLLLPHALYVAYREYKDWLERRIDREVYGHDEADWGGKRKRYPDAHHDEPAFRLTDDGEIEPVSGGKAKRGYDAPPARHERRQPDRPPRHADTRRRGRKDDTDEWDLKRLFKKVRDILD